MPGVEPFPDPVSGGPRSHRSALPTKTTHGRREPESAAPLPEPPADQGPPSPRSWLSPLHVLLFLVVAVPALAVAWRREGGEVVLVLYRQPKLAAFDLLAWAFLVVFAFRWARRPLAFRLWPTLSRPPVLLLSLFLAWITTTALWGVVPENHLHELRQTSLGIVLLVTLLSWSRSDPRVAATVRWGLIGSMAVVTLVGYVQMIRPIPFLAPVQPSMGVEFPSLMGYKNPAALAVVGQIFLLLGIAGDSTGPLARRLLVGVLLVAELGYLFRLQSRTAYLALVAGAIWWLLLQARSPRGRRTAVRIAALTAATLVIVLVADRDARTRVKSAAEIASSPRAYLESDRGVYLLNSIQMALCRPLGVGLGDWQTAYPVFRRHDRYRSFDESFQVRRAHSDYAQILGEAGWLGLIAWCLFLLAAVASSTRIALLRKKPQALSHAAQLVALCAAMATDYLLDLPFHRQLFFLVVFLALQAPSKPSPESGGRPGLRSRMALPAAVLIVALVHSFYSVSSLLRSGEAALMTRSYLQALQSRDAATRERLLDEVVGHGRRFLALAGHDKTLYRDYLVLGHGHLLRGEPEVARRIAERSLRLHPYHPPTFLLMSALETDAERSAAWRRGYEHVRDEAICGFEVPYPTSPPPRGALGP